MSGKKKFRCVIAGATAVCVLLGGETIYHVVASAKDKTLDAATDTEADTTEQEETASTSFSEDGTTQIGSVSQIPEFSVNAVTMTVEEVYHAAGDTVAAGDALFKISDDSMQEATAYYESAVAEAKRTLELAQADLSSGDLEAQSTKQETTLDAQTAAESYQAAVDEIDVEVAEKKEAYDEAVESAQQYQEDLDNGTYYTSNGLSEKKDAQTQAETELQTAQSNLETAQKEADAADLTVGSSMTELKSKIADGADSATLATLVDNMILAYETQQKTASALTEAQKAADTAQSNVDQAAKAFETAVESYNKDTEEASEKITELTEQAEKLLTQYEEAERNSVVEKVQLKNEYDTAELEGSYADGTYQSSVISLEQAVEEAQRNYDTLVAEQAALLAVSDGVITASQDGTLSYVAYAEGDTLKADTAVVLYSDNSTISISVEVPQEKITEVSVGEEVAVQISGNRMGTQTGTITSIASGATTGGSISNVTYAVVVTIDNTEGTLSAGSSAVVTFEMGE